MKLSENEMTSLRPYAKAHLYTHPFVNNIPLPEELKLFDIGFVNNELLSGKKDAVKVDFYDS